ncbi:MAG: hypothetical protein HPY45_01660 [Anaerolineae bacterium]|nr:hypothetical protein [Anaerolineae bacterium]
MKMIIAIIRDTDYGPISHGLTIADFRVTHIASTGSFLRRGQSTLLIGVEDDQLEHALDIIRKNCTKASENDPRHTIIFVLKVDDFLHF